MFMLAAHTALAAEKAPVMQPLSFLPQRVSLGMTVMDFQKARPEAKRFYIARDSEVARPNAPDLTKGEHVFLEQMPGGSDFQTATYLVKNGVVVSITVGREWMPSKESNKEFLPDGKRKMPPEQASQAALRSLREKVFIECKKRFGDRYSIDAVSINRSDMVKYLVPRFSWKTNGIGATLICTSEYQDVEILAGFIGARIWLIEDAPEPLLPAAEKVDAQVLSRLAEPIMGRTMQPK
jgi:hypothetical protein